MSEGLRHGGCSSKFIINFIPRDGNSVLVLKGLLLVSSNSHGEETIKKYTVKRL